MEGSYELMGYLQEVLYSINAEREIDNISLYKGVRSALLLEQGQREICLGAIFTGLLAKKTDAYQVGAVLKAVFEMDQFKRDKQPFHSTSKYVIEYIGSGKKGIKTINISTPSAIIATSAGASILKKGSVSTSSLTGSADFMSIIGAKHSKHLSQINKELEEVGFSFVNIESTIPEFDGIYNGKFLAPHILSLGLPAIITPIKGDIIVYGLSFPNIQLSAQVLKEYGIENAQILTNTCDGIHYIDELGLSGNSQIIDIKQGEVGRIKNFYAEKEMMLSNCNLDEIRQRGTADENIKYVLKILMGEGSETQTNTLCLNAANLLVVGKIYKDIKEAFKVAKENIYNGKAINKLEEYLEINGGDMDQFRRMKVG